MARKKKKSIFIGMFIGFFRLLWFIIKGIYLVFRFLFIKLKKKKQEVEYKNKNRIRPKIDARYEGFEIVKSLDGDYFKFENKLLSNPSAIGIILGARGTGKSAIGMKLLENIKAKTDRNVCAMGFKKETLPYWINVIQKIDGIPNSSIVLIDEAGIEFSSRESMSGVNKLLSSLLLIARHKDLSVFFISQNSANLEINVIRQSDFLILKPSSLLQKDFERGKIKEIYSEAQEHFDEFKNVEGLTYIYSSEFRGFVKNGLPSFWNKDVSKAYK